MTQQRIDGTFKKAHKDREEMVHVYFWKY
jgi:hypothetical protein